MKKWVRQTVKFLLLLIIMNFAIAWLLQLTMPDFTYTLAGWFGREGVEASADLLVDFTFFTALATTGLVFVLSALKNRSHH